MCVGPTPNTCGSETSSGDMLMEALMEVMVGGATALSWFRPRVDTARVLSERPNGAPPRLCAAQPSSVPWCLSHL
eukprot:2263980-Alexandrium_andersonii.AAC.2